MQQKKQKKQSRSPKRNPLTTNTSLTGNTTNITPNKTVRKRGMSATIATDSCCIEKRDQGEKRKVSKMFTLTNQEKNKFVRKESKQKEIQRRRQEIGLDFLNKIPKKQIQLILQRQKSQRQSNFQQDIIKKVKSTKNFDLHLKQKNQLHQQQKQNEQMNRKKETKKQLQNTQNILKKNSSQKRCKKRSITSITQKKETIQRNSSQKTKNEKTTQITCYEGELLEKYKKIQARYSKIHQTFFDESSCVQYLTDTDPYVLPSQPTSNKQYQVLTEEFSLNRDEKFQLKEFGILENKFNIMHSAAIKIQKVWRGFIARKLILDQQFEQYYYKQTEVFEQETFRSQFRFEKDSQSIQQGREQTLNQLTHQTDINFILDLESGQVEKEESKEQKCSPKISAKFVKYQKMKWQELLNYISQLQNQVQEKTINEVLKDLKVFTQQCSQDCSLSKFQIKKLEIQVPQFSQESIVMSEIRQAMCSEKLMKQILTSTIKQQKESIFEEQPFQQFATKKIDEIMNRNQMDELIKMRQVFIQEQQKSQHQTLIKEFEQKLISPKTFEDRYHTLEKWVYKQYEEIENNKINFEKGWQGLYDTFIQTEKELKFLQQQQKNSQLSQISYSQQFINYSISAFSDSAYKNSIQDISNQNDTLLLNNYNEEFENKRLKTHTSNSQTPDEKLKHLENQHEIIEWNDEQLLTSQQFLQNQQIKDQKIIIKNAPQKSIEQAEIDSLHQEVQNEEQSWLNYNEFKFYVFMDISNLVFNELIEEFRKECIQQQF